MGKEARAFKTSKAYTAGDLVLNGGILYEFITNHSAGAWNSEQVKAFDKGTAGMLAHIMAVYDNMIEATAFANSVTFEPQQITGTRYKYKLTT